MSLVLHNDPDLFRDSVRFIAEQTGFAPNLIEKDYLCSVLLEYLAHTSDGSLIFKGGTCLAKVHFNFKRLSEDLDFMIPVAIDANRKVRASQVSTYKNAVSHLSNVHPIFHVQKPLEGRNESRQYIASIGYKSILDAHQNSIELEIGLREPLLADPIDGKAATILRNAANPDEGLPPIPFPCLSFEEAMAEKFRAALTRKEVAIRDFYDIDYAILKKDLQVHKQAFIEMIRKKLAVPGNNPADMSKERISDLSNQLDARLKPVLRPNDFVDFDLNRAIDYVAQMKSRL